MHPDYLGDVLTAEQFDEWYVDSYVDPWGEERQDMRAGVVAFAALAPHMKPGHGPPKPSEFILYDPGKVTKEEEKPPQSVEEMKAIVAQLKPAFEKT